MTSAPRTRSSACPAVDAALGLFGGIPLGVSHALALDGLVSATYVPTFNNSNMAVSLPDGSLKLGYGGATRTS